MVPQKEPQRPLRLSLNLLSKHKDVRKSKFNLIFSLRPGLGQEGLISLFQQNFKVKSFGVANSV